MAGGEKDGKTEKPTAKRLDEARKNGQIARSPELVSWVAILVGFSMLQSLVTRSARFLDKEMLEMARLMAAPDTSKALSFMAHSVAQAFLTVLPLTLTFMVLSVIGHLAQVRFVFSAKSLVPKLSKLNPVTGIKRLFSPQSLFQLGKDLVKLIVLGGVAYQTLAKTIMTLAVGGGTYSTGHLIAITSHAVITFVREFAAVGLVIGILDYLYQRRKIGEQLKMSKHEIKEESRQQDLPPEIKGKIRQKQRQMATNRMMAAIADADVVIVNPVHIAIALEYDAQKGAPRIVAIGAGFVAEKIRDRADEHNVPIVQDIPLARTLHRSCELGDEIPGALFEAVARVLAFVFALKKRGTSAGFHKMPGTPDLAEADRLEAEAKDRAAAARDVALAST